MIEKIKILIVEDDAVSAFLAEKILEKNFVTDTVKNGYEALIAVEKIKYDVVLMDINLGDVTMDGIKTMRLIKQNSAHKYLKIFAITMYSNSREWYKKLGFEDQFLKPLNEHEITKAIYSKTEKVRRDKCLLK